MQRELDLGVAFHPRAVALVGASERVHYHQALLRNLRTFGFPTDQVHLVNPKYTSLLGRPCYPSVAATPEPVDLALIATPAESVAAVIEDCGRAGVRAALVVSAGFAESGPEGRRLQERLACAARAGGVALIGPSSLGLLSLHHQLGLFASELPPSLAAGNVSAIFQSGGMLNLFLQLLAWRRIGVALAVVTGNEATLTLTDFVERAVEDSATGVVVVYAEAIRHAGRFARALEHAEEVGKSVIVLRAGTSPRGQRNVQSHSGNLASGGVARRALLRQRNAIEVGNLDELIEVTAAASGAQESGIRPTRRRVALMSVSGGDCTLLADIAHRTGWELPDLPASAHAALVEIVGKATLTDNPLDVGGLWRRGLMPAVAAVVARQADVDVVAFRLNLPDTPEAGLLQAYEELTQRTREAGKLAVALTRASERLAEHWYDFFARLGVPFLQEYERGLVSLGRVVDAQARRRRREAEATATGAGAGPRRPEIAGWFADLPPGPLSYAQAARLLDAYGIPLARATLVHSPEEALAAADQLGYPVVVKLDSRAVLHRSDVGAVRVDLRTGDEVREAYRAVVASARGAAIDGVVVQEHVRGVAELLIGINADADVGAMLLFGLGGVFVEVFQDVAVRPIPVRGVDFEEMLGELRSRPLLFGARQRPPADVAATRQAVLRLSALACDLGATLAECDINPLIVLPDGQGVRVVDALVVRAGGTTALRDGTA